MQLNDFTHDIAQVSRISGIPKDLLRQWERRYGYPDPVRDHNGDRQYSRQQLDKLVVIRQLVDQGKRPGKLVKLDVEELRSMLEVPDSSFERDVLIEKLQSGNAQEIADWFEALLKVHGLRAFVHQVMAPATQVVGDAWEAGEIAIHEEHLYTEVLKRIARRQLGEVPASAHSPRMMLTTVPGEQHSLGLLMVEIVARLSGAEVIAFGTEMPFKEIKQAAIQHKVDVIALSFSAGFKCDDALVMLSGLRQTVPEEIAIWAGGSAFDRNTQMPERVEMRESLQSVEAALGRWCSDG